MINCKKAAQIASEKKDRSLPLHQRMELWFHLLMCTMCRTYRKQIDLISRLSQRAGLAVMQSDATTALSDDCKQRIKDRLTHQ